MKVKLDHASCHCNNSLVHEEFLPPLFSSEWRVIGGRFGCRGIKSSANAGYLQGEPGEQLVQEGTCAATWLTAGFEFRAS